MTILDTESETEICALCGQLIENSPLIIIGRGKITLENIDRRLLVLHRSCLAEFNALLVRP